MPLQHLVQKDAVDESAQTDPQSDTWRRDTSGPGRFFGRPQICSIRLRRQAVTPFYSETINDETHYACTRNRL